MENREREIESERSRIMPHTHQLTQRLLLHIVSKKENFKYHSIKLYFSCWNKLRRSQPQYFRGLESDLERGCVCICLEFYNHLATATAETWLERLSFFEWATNARHILTYDVRQLAVDRSVGSIVVQWLALQDFATSSCKYSSKLR